MEPPAAEEQKPAQSVEKAAPTAAKQDEEAEEAPAFSLPSFSFEAPKIELPEMPEIELPDMPKIELPEMPRFEAPEVKASALSEQNALLLPEMTGWGHRCWRPEGSVSGQPGGCPKSQC